MNNLKPLYYLAINGSVNKAGLDVPPVATDKINIAETITPIPAFISTSSSTNIESACFFINCFNLLLSISILTSTSLYIVFNL